MRRTPPHASNLRKGRYSRKHHYYFLTTSVARRRRIFDIPDHAVVVLETIRWLHVHGRFFIDAAVVMPDHVHLAGRLGDAGLAEVMHTLKGYSAGRLARAGVEKPIWQKGYHDHGLRGHEDYKVRVRYLLRNPVRAGLVERVEDFPYVILPDWWA